MPLPVFVASLNYNAPTPPGVYSVGDFFSISLKLPADLVVVAGAMRSASASADVGLVNSAMLFRSDHGKMVAASVLDSRVPIPSGQWWPGGPSWRPSNMMKFNGQTVAVSICYEDLLPWTALGSVAERPDVVVDMSNLWFDFHHAVDHAESQTLSGWARLFGVPIVRSVGTGTPTENQQP